MHHIPAAIAASLILGLCVLVHIAPIFKRALEDGFADAVEPVADDVADEPLASRAVEHLADHRAGLGNSWLRLFAETARAPNGSASTN